jgi:hypothetical protein
MSLKSRLAKLQRDNEKQSPREGTRDFAAEEAKRWDMTARILELTPEDLRKALASALEERDERGFSTKRSSHLHSWICDLGFDRTRLPSFALYVAWRDVDGNHRRCARAIDVNPPVRVDARGRLRPPQASNPQV